MNKVSLNDAISFGGFLEKKSPSIFAGWQKRYFKILEGRVMTYAKNKEEKESKGSINLEDISDIKSTDKKCFSFFFADRTWDLRAESDEMRDKWITVIKILQNEIKKTQQVETSAETLPHIVEGRSRTNTKRWKNNQQDSSTIEILKKSGFTNKDDENSEKAIKLKLKTLNPEIPDIKIRIQYGFLSKKHKNELIYQKRWFFIMSSRPVNDSDYEKEDNMVFKNPSAVVLDTLYYYTFDNESDESKPKGEIPLHECSEISCIDKDNKFFIIVDMGDRKYEFCSDYKSERDKWYMSLRNSRKTAKEIKKSYTKRPRNITRLLRIIENEGISKLKEICEKEKETIMTNYKDLKDFDLFDGYYVKSLQDLLYNTLDACVIFEPPKTEIVKIYVEIFNTSYLLLIQKFWSNCYSNLDQNQIVKMASLLFNHETILHQFGVTDTNFSQNGRELIKILIKKTFVSMKTLIESILKNEREIKASKNSEGIFITNGPMDLFKMLYSLIDIFKRENYNIKFIIDQFMNLCKECTIQYLIGVDSVVCKKDLDVDKEFLIAVSNNTLKINSQLEDLVDEIKGMKVLTDKETDDAVGHKEIASALTLISQNSISRFVNDLSEALVNEFQDHFLTLELSKILNVTFESYGRFSSYMHVAIQKKCWNEVLKATLYQYIKSLLTTASKKVKKLEELTGKIRNDKNTLIDAYTKILGEHSTKETVRILDDFLDFLDISPEMISVSCTKIREFNGPSFSLATCKALINLRCDLNKDEKNDAINSCKEILDNFSNSEGNNFKSSGFFENLENEIKIQEKEENELAEQLENVQEEIPENKIHTLNLADFLNYGVEVDDADSEKEEENSVTIARRVSSPTELIVSDVVYEGIMKKKSYSTWQERFFQIKNQHLYWYKTKKAKESQNSLAIAEMKKVQGHKSCKFLIASGEKLYKFSCENEEMKENWIKALNNEIKKLKCDSVKKLEHICEIKLKKKVISDYYELPNIGADKFYMKKKVEESLKTETFFLTKEKSKPTIKPNKKILQSKTIIEEQITRADEKSFSTSPKHFDTLEIGLIDKKPKKANSLFSCCNKFLMLFKKKKSITDYES